ncbi:rifin, partial [Plasmodium reichenowi]
MCGCALGGVAASVGVFGGLGIYGWKSAAIATVEKAAAAKGAEEGIKILIHKLKEELVLKVLYGDPWDVFINTENYLNEFLIFERVKHEYGLCFSAQSECGNNLMLSHYSSGGDAERITTALKDAKTVVVDAVKAADNKTISVTATEIETVQAGKLAEIADTSYNWYTAIGYSVLAILIIVLVMIIIYLVLRYRRKKKMKKKAQYTKLLNQ